MNATFIRHAACPRCGSKDNVGEYSDGSAYCFGCGYYRRGDRSVSYALRTQEGNPQPGGNGCYLPPDTTKEIPLEGWKWLSKYGITEEEVERNGIFWSSDAGGLVLAVSNPDGGLVGYQVRNFREGKKYLTTGRSLSMCLSLLEQAYPKEERPLVFVEDIVSSIKVRRYSPCIPLLGSHIPLELIRKASERFSSFCLWLDMDKAKESVKQCLNMKQKGFNIRPVFTELDPKEVKDEGIRKHIFGSE